MRIRYRAWMLVVEYKRSVQSPEEYRYSLRCTKERNKGKINTTSANNE